VEFFNTIKHFHELRGFEHRSMNPSSTVTLVGGPCLFLLGIHLTEGLKGLAGDSLRRALQPLLGGRFGAVVSGAVFTVAI
jgi:phosphate:Na+ symporter